MYIKAKISFFFTMKLMNLTEFYTAFPAYPLFTVFFYKIYRDLLLKNELETLDILDGGAIDYNFYYFKGKPVNPADGNGKCRYIIPIDVNSDVDLVWLNNFSQKCDTENAELFIAIGNIESVS
jgi:hypothetical protein